MSDIALAEPQARQIAPIAAKPAKKERISKRLAQAIDLLAKGRAITQKAAAEAVGMNAEHLSRSLKKEHVRVFLAQRMRSTIALGALRASERVIELVDADSEHVSLDAARHVLAIEGIKPAETSQVSVNVNVSPGYVIDLSNGPERGSDKPSSLIEG
jgi:tyrosine-protein phosphatase YwqE